MTPSVVSHLHTPKTSQNPFSIAIWLLVAGFAGVFIATQPLPILIIALVGVVFVLVSLVTPLASIVILLILAPLRTLIATEAQINLPLDIGQLALIATLGTWVLHSLVFRRKLPRLHWSPVCIPILLFIILIALTAFNAAFLGSWLNEWLKWIQVLLLVLLVLDLARQERWQWLLFGLTLAGLANAIIGIYEFFGGSGADHLLIGGRFFRAFGTFGQPNPFAGFMGLIAPLALMAAVGYGLRFWRNHADRLSLLLLMFYLPAAGVMVSGLFASWSRGAWLGFAAAFAAMAFALPRKIHTGLAFVVVLIVFTGLLWFTGLLPRSIVARISSSTEEFFAFEDVRGVDITSENYAVVERLSHWQAALNMARDYPWLGVGMGNYELLYYRYRLINWDEPLGHAHNYYLNMLAEGGIIGLLVYGKVWLAIIYLTWQARKHPDSLSRMVTIGLLGTWTYLSIHSIFDNLYVNNIFLHIGLMLGILGILYHQANTYTRLRTL